MGRRGSRSGSGRKSGAMHRSDRANPEQALRPLAVMLDNMRFYHQGAPELLEQLLIREATADPIAVQKDTARIDSEKLAVNEALAPVAPKPHDRDRHSSHRAAEARPT